MRMPSAPTFTIAAGLAAMALAFFSNAGAQDQTLAETAPKRLSSAIFAGGCFWCVESDFDKVDGVIETVSGYTGGEIANPTYKQVSKENTGHYEAVKVTYDPDLVSYDTLVEYFFRHVDPTDPYGQFCDKGDSYRTAIFVNTDDERAVAEAEIAEIETSGVLKDPVVTRVIQAETFWPAEDYHQNYYKKNPLKYRYYRASCGRDGRVEDLWDESVGH
ncbi:MAG: peptide-methionine (S)-S-oxide reductase MsrA [Hyphomonas sp.]|uniref:peptide-methionine (S)-S-oxide reductase n=1 Tax=hydrothermal vent metagenome TaxID=652676 RepID=A0A170PTW5_9ZZZZ|nr:MULTISPECIES: peptide-methionine (S)-S-oxide reductase MsrA [unclassified Hyphomonas]MBO6581554.1 peptide-methionine (S)-S-oxide reductase MsrA [Hyphomonas sp.]